MIMKKGTKMSEESRERMRKSSKERWSRPEEHLKTSLSVKEHWKTHENPNKGRKWTDEQKKNMGPGISKYWRLHPEKHPMLGKTHTAAARKIISDTHKGKIIPLETRLKMSDGHKRYYQKPENRKKRSESQKKTIQKYPELLLNLYKGGYTSKKGYREDLNHCFRSKWEANFARVMHYEKTPYYYEKYIFDLGNGEKYIPDFYIPYDDYFVEVKGYWFKKGRDKFLLFKRLYPNITLVVLDEGLYNYLKENYKEIIPNWEN